MDSRLKTAGMTVNVSIFFKRLNSYKIFHLKNKMLLVAAAPYYAMPSMTWTFFIVASISLITVPTRRKK
jgi:hypothetical protein